jgi:hypothetical protein
MVAFRQAIADVINNAPRPHNIRHFFYVLVGLGVVAKDERDYARVQYNSVPLRRDGTIDPDMVVDETRRVEQAPTWRNVAEFLADVPEWYRSDPWQDADTTVVVLSEKKGMTPIIREVTDEYAVPLFPTAGYSSVTFARDAAKLIVAAGKPAEVLQVGDRDNSGLDMVRAAEKEICYWVAKLCADAGIPELFVSFYRVAVLEEHIARYNLPTRPPKAGDKRTGFDVRQAVEIDAMEADDVQELLRDAIRHHMPDSRLAGHRRRDAAMRARLRRLLQELAAGEEDS